MRDNLESNGAVAITCSRPTTYQTVQVKGEVVAIREPTTEQRAAAEAHADAFSREVEDLGAPPRHRPAPVRVPSRRGDDRRRRAVRPDARPEGGSAPVTEPVPLESILSRADHHPGHRRADRRQLLPGVTDDPRGTATPLHLDRNEEETFYVLDGEVGVLIDGQWSELSTGDYALVSRNTPHAYVVRSERARMLVTFSPAGFEEAFTDLGVPVESSPELPAETVMPSAEEVTAAFAPYGCEILGPPPAL
jgi:mannose-6-phosphate isomerase-like protein (cupin superfamily)